MSEGAGTKRSSEGGNAYGGGKKSRGDTVTLRFLLQSKHAGGIIGKGGETIKRLRSTYSAIVIVPDGITKERVLSIGADRDGCINVFRECIPLMHEPPYPVNTGGEGRQRETHTHEVNFLVHSSQVGGIIGKAGARIKQIREETDANIKVYPNCLAGCKERVVAIGGEEEEVVNGLQQILDVMHEQPIKGEVVLYDPADPSGIPYDDYNDNSNFNGMRGGNQMGGGPPGGMGGMGGMGQGSNFGGPQGGYGGPGGGGFMGSQQDFGNNFGGANNYGNQGQQQRDGGFGGGPGGNYNNNAPGGNFGGAGGGGAGMQGNSQTTSTQVTIPNDMAGAIIGQGGRRIQEIRQKCGATIKFADPEPGKKDRLITVSGNDEQIQYAQYLMQQCVLQNHRT